MERHLGSRVLRAGTREPDLWPAVARAICILLALLCLFLFVLSLPAAYDRLTHLPLELRTDLARWGIPIDAYAGLCLTCDATYLIGSILIAGLTIRRRPEEPMALFVSLFLVTFAGAESSAIDALAAHHATVGAFTILLAALGYIGLNGMFYLFPDGRFVPRWTWAMFALAIVEQVPFNMPDTSPYNPNSWPDPLKLPLLLGIFGVGLGAQVYRYRCVSNAVQRQQTKWVVYGAVAAIVLMFVARSADHAGPMGGQPLPALTLARAPLLDLAFLFFPLTIGFSVLRYRLWDVDLIISRTLVYGGLTVGIITLYILIVGFVGAELRSSGNLAVSLLATGAIAVLFQPLRELLQRWANRLVYGRRDDPYAVLSELGRRLEGTLAPESALPAIVETVARTLRLPYAAISVAREPTPVIAAAYGSPVDHRLDLPLIYGAEEVGRLILGMPAGEDSFSGADRRLLEDLARQAGVAVYAARLTSDLRTSREHVVSAREEERRRLRRDLHDGLGPTLGSFGLQLGGVRNMLAAGDIHTADATVSELIDSVESTVAEVRRLVYALRPPALDEYGLAGAVRLYIAEQERLANGTLRIDLDAPDTFEPLPAAIEVAVFRITQEALANVVHHAGASTCVIRLGVDADHLMLEIEDDGVGMPASRRTGVGLVSMRERAEEVGGSLAMASGRNGGTRVTADLPLPETGP